MKIYFVSLGCDKNLVDSEVMLGKLADAGYEFTQQAKDADIAVVNTCCFINDAQKESIDTIISLGQLKKDGKLKKLIICGCLAQRYYSDFSELLPEVDALLGIASIDRIVEAVKSSFDDMDKDFGSRCFIDELTRKIPGDCRRVVSTGGFYEYLKIAEGCDKHCTYCIIPKIRGPYRSVPMEELLAQARTLAEGGTVELILVAQEVTLYGLDLYGRKSLPKLLERLSEIENIKWIRLLYCYPEEIDDELIETIKDNPKVLHYLDMPIQSGSDSILKRMGRKTTREDIVALVSKLRNKIPDICLRTTLISGFPTEKHADHIESLDLVKNIEFDRLGVFTYSKEEGTGAYNMPNQVPAFVKKIRRNEIMKLQKGISLSKTRKMMGSVVDVLIEGVMPENGVYVGRTYKDAPEVDGMIFVSSPTELLSGCIVPVKVTGYNEYDLIGEVL